MPFFDVDLAGSVYRIPRFDPLDVNICSTFVD